MTTSSYTSRSIAAVRRRPIIRMKLAAASATPILRARSRRAAIGYRSRLDDLLSPGGRSSRLDGRRLLGRRELEPTLVRGCRTGRRKLDDRSSYSAITAHRRHDRAKHGLGARVTADRAGRRLSIVDPPRHRGRHARGVRLFHLRIKPPNLSGRPGERIVATARAVAGRAETANGRREGNVNYLIGTDEAGYGPPLGPLVVAATVWELPDGDLEPSDVNLYDRLRHCVCRRAERARRRRRGAWLSPTPKALYNPAQGLAQLEQGVLVALSTLDQKPATWHEAWDALCLHGTDGGDTAPWHADYEARLPLSAEAKEIDRLAGKLRNGFARSGIQLCAIAGRCFSRALQ